jgi:hypothetical protein
MSVLARMLSGIRPNPGGIYDRAAPVVRVGQKQEMMLFLSILSYRQAWGAETFEDCLKKLSNFPGVAPLDLAAVQHVQGLAVTE